MAGSQNWAIAQSPEGTLFVGNNRGLVVKEGQNWKLFGMNFQIVRAVSYYNSKIYVGGGQEFGYFEKTAFGDYKYYSLVKNIAKDWGEIWEIYSIGESVFFRSGNSIFKFNYYSDRMEKRIVFKEVVFSKKINNTILAQISGKGIVVLDKNLNIEETWVKGEAIEHITIKNIEIIDGEYYFFSLSHGILRLKNKMLEPIQDNIQKILENAQIYCSLKIDDRIIIGTVLEGVYILNSNFELERHLCISNGLRNNTVLSLYADFTKNIWAGLDNGISFICFNSPLSFFRFNKPIGTGYAHLKHEDFNYWGTNQGVYYSIGNSSNIQLIPKTQGQVWSLYKIGNNIYCGHHNGLYKVVKDDAELIDTHRGIFTINRLNNASAYFLILSYRGLSLYKLENEELRFVNKINTKETIPNKVMRDTFGDFWFQTAEGFTSFGVDSVAHTVKFLNKFNYPDRNNNILSLRDTLYFFHKNEFFFFNHDKNVFEKASLPSKTTLDFIINAMFKLEETSFKNFLHTSKSNVAYLLAMKASLRSNIMDTVSKIGENYILNSDEGFISFNSAFENQLDTFSLKTYISEIECKALDSIHYSFAKESTLKYNQNSIRFRFATNDHRGNIEYEYRLVGLNKNFSFTKEEFKEYVNLFEGNYRFEVFARNQLGSKSPIVSYSFTILPPFYRTSWAYFFYVLMIMGMMYYIFIKIQLSFRRKEKQIQEQRKKDILELEHKQKIDRLNHENEIMQIEQKHLKNSIILREQDLVNATRNTIQKNEFLMEIKDSLSSLKAETNIEFRNSHIHKILSLIDSNLNTEKDWEVFEFYFNEIHQNFFESLKKEYLDLTPTELKLCAYIRLNKSSKEISSLMNISVRGVETGRYRLRKKLGISREENILDVFVEIENKYNNDVRL